MKVICIYERVKEVLYAGVRLRISRYHDWMAVDKRGTIYSYLNKPIMNEHAEEWRVPEKPVSEGDEYVPSPAMRNTELPYYVGEAELGNTDWRETLEYVGDDEDDQF